MHLPGTPGCARDLADLFSEWEQHDREDAQRRAAEHNQHREESARHLAAMQAISDRRHEESLREYPTYAKRLAEVRAKLGLA